ncbi:glycerophosphoryl diester phosphodiesterase membrane domain-containing protein, partial [Streptococcus suis]
STTLWLGILILIFLLLFFWIAALFMYALPNIYFEHRCVKESIAYSWEKTRVRKQIGSLFRLIWLITFQDLIFTGVGGLL